MNHWDASIWPQSTSLVCVIQVPVWLSVCHPDYHYAVLRGELESNAQNLEAESWSIAVDQNYLKALNKEAVKKQDIIYGKLDQLGL